MQIDDDDLQRVIDAGRAVTLDSSRTVLHAVPRYYIVDGHDRVADPRGMHGQRLDVEMHLVTASRGAAQNAYKCVTAAGVDVELVAAQPIVASRYALRREEALEGAVMVDLGAGTTDLAVYVDGAVTFTTSLPIGGAFVTRDLIVGLRAPAEVAEEAKLNFGHALPELAPDEPVTLDGFTDQRDRQISRRLIAEIVRARVEEITMMVLKTIKRAKLDQHINGGYRALRRGQPAARLCGAVREHEQRPDARRHARRALRPGRAGLRQLGDLDPRPAALGGQLRATARASVARRPGARHPASAGSPAGC